MSLRSSFSKRIRQMHCESQPPLHPPTLVSPVAAFSRFVHPREPWEMHFDVKEKMGLPIPNKCLFGDSDAADVSEADWEKTVMDDNTSVLVNFYAPWCPHCQKFVPVKLIHPYHAKQPPRCHDLAYSDRHPVAHHSMSRVTPRIVGLTLDQYYRSS